MKKPTAKVELLVPMVPNFVRSTRGETIDIADLSPPELRRLASAWSYKLYEVAAKRIADRIRNKREP